MQHKAGWPCHCTAQLCARGNNAGTRAGFKASKRGAVLLVCWGVCVCVCVRVYCVFLFFTFLFFVFTFSHFLFPHSFIIKPIPRLMGWLNLIFIIQTPEHFLPPLTLENRPFCLAFLISLFVHKKCNVQYVCVSVCVWGVCACVYLFIFKWVFTMVSTGKMALENSHEQNT